MRRVILQASLFTPVFTDVTRDGKRARETRLNDEHIARLIKACVQNAGLCASVTSSAEVDERYVQKQLAHASEGATASA